PRHYVGYVTCYYTNKIARIIFKGTEAHHDQHGNQTDCGWNDPLKDETETGSEKNGHHNERFAGIARHMNGFKFFFIISCLSSFFHCHKRIMVVNFRKCCKIIFRNRCWSSPFKRSTHSPTVTTYLTLPVAITVVNGINKQSKTGSHDERTDT